jgi:superfamily I DNA and/or RNA helicase
MQKVDGEDAVDHASVRLVKDNAHVERALLDGEVDVVGGTPWLWAREELAGLLDTLFVDEAGQMSLANVVAVSGAARNVVLLGDPQQLDQPLQGVHPAGADRSALAHFLGEDETVPADKGVFLERTWRLHPLICDLTSQLFYEDRLEPVDGLAGQRVLGRDELSGAGVRWMPVHHEGNTNDSPQEAERVAEIVRALVGRTYVDAAGVGRPIGLADILIVSPFNAHRLRIRGLLGPQARVGTVDKFQGQEAPVSIYTMATSRPEDAPRGLGFLYSLHRLNVATSRARALAIVVASPALLTAVPRTPEQLRMANGLCAFVEAATASS